MTGDIQGEEDMTEVERVAETDGATMGTVIRVDFESGREFMRRYDAGRHATRWRRRATLILLLPLVVPFVWFCAIILWFDSIRVRDKWSGIRSQW